ncbi:YcfA family protein (fragment) [Candidatus Sulfopaludibacter sp. SbA3]
MDRLGFSTARQIGSHVHMAQGNRHFTVPMHRNLAVGTLQSILRQAGITLDKFMNTL